MIGLAPSLAQEDTTLAPIVVESDADAQEAGVSSSGPVKTDRYVGKSATVGTKTQVELAKVPQSVSTVSRKELEDRNVQSLVQATNYSSGVRTGVFGFDPRFDTVFIRGFNVTDSGYYRDGLRDLGGVFSVARKEPYGIEGVTILKGPSSVLYGGGSPGGIVNVVSKRPTEVPFNEIEVQAGNFDRRQINIDSSGPVAGNDNILYRITGLARGADTQFVATKDDRIYIAPALTLRSDDHDTQLTILGEYSNITSGGAAGFLSDNGNLTDIEHGDPAYGDMDVIQKRIGYEFQHRFSDDLIFRQNLRAARINTDMKYVSVVGISPDGLSATRTANRLIDRADTFAIDNQLEWRVDTGPLAHTLLAGIDYTYLDSGYDFGSVAAPDLDLVDRNYGQQPITPPTALSTLYTLKQRQTGVYLQDQIEYDRFVLTLGGRYDWLDANQYGNFGHFSGRAGLAYLFDNGIAPYVSYSTSFAPNTGRSATGEYFDPSEGEQFEVGVKYAPTDLNLAINAAVFNIEQTNTLASDPVVIGASVTRGKVRSRGFEIEAKANLIDNLDLLASYTYLDMEILAGDNPGKVPAGIPANQFALWAHYQMPSGPLEGLSLGAGARYYSKTWKDDGNDTGKNADRILVDAAVAYDFGAANPKLEGLTARLNVSNVFDNRETTCSGSYCYVEEGRTVIGSLRYRF
ncbi:TonB-dependent siderophore receptor [Rhizobiaceae bacterium BDR2-2]|uniref:TonB-dependent siderophore receptor n=1 Tax=Ectorhizobium quercum TaxID=2965071 RepID=A0AAE3SX49_9HYPH|nr:TonB-dependent siderophore receptor [Ectorhizobium quercum]MCX8999877.1 TonB-dependent siderophore receptor [Ectorhizobium quercum]